MVGEPVAGDYREADPEREKLRSDGVLERSELGPCRWRLCDVQSRNEEREGEGLRCVEEADGPAEFLVVALIANDLPTHVGHPSRRRLFGPVVRVRPCACAPRAYWCAGQALQRVVVRPADQHPVAQADRRFEQHLVVSDPPQPVPPVSRLFGT